MRRRRMDMCCVQETRWKGASARMIGDGYKFYYAGERSGRNGVGIVVRK